MVKKKIFILPKNGKARNKVSFPSLTILEQVKKSIKEFPNQKKESLRKVHYGVFLLCSQSGLRVSEAVGFDLENKTKKGLYRIEKPKRKKKRLVYVPKETIRELKNQN
jgi:integrase